MQGSKFGRENDGFLEITKKDLDRIYGEKDKKKGGNGKNSFKFKGKGKRKHNKGKKKHHK